MNNPVVEDANGAPVATKIVTFAFEVPEGANEAHLRQLMCLAIHEEDPDALESLADCIIDTKRVQSALDVLQICMNYTARGEDELHAQEVREFFTGMLSGMLATVEDHHDDAEYAESIKAAADVLQDAWCSHGNAPLERIQAPRK